jgi:hypothetical protein
VDMSAMQYVHVGGDVPPLQPDIRGAVERQESAAPVEKHVEDTIPTVVVAEQVISPQVRLFRSVRFSEHVDLRDVTGDTQEGPTDRTEGQGPWDRGPRTLGIEGTPGTNGPWTEVPRTRRP